MSSQQRSMFARAVPLALVALLSATVACTRTALGPVQETMRLSLGLTDNQLALLQGPALSLPLLLFAIPLGLLIDRYSRKRLLVLFAIINLIGGVWSGLATGFAQLVIGRFLVGSTTAAIGIAALSFLADFYAPEHRGRATMMTSVGSIVGMSAAFTFGGVLLAIVDQNDDSWRWALCWLAAPVLPAALAMLFLREPGRSNRPIKSIGFQGALADLWRLRVAFLPLLAGHVLIGAAGAATGSWGAPVLARVFELPSEHIGTVMGASLLIGGLAGPVLGGMLADFCQRSGGPKRTMSVLSALATMSVLPALFPLAPDSFWASVLLVIFTTLGAGTGVIATTALTVVLPADLRGLCLAVSFTAFAVFDGMLAPLAVSSLSGALGGGASIGQALALTCVTTSLLGGLVFALGKRWLPREPAQMQCRGDLRVSSHR